MSGSRCGDQGRELFHYQSFWVSARVAGWYIAAVLVCALGFTLPALAQSTVIRVNAGGGAYTDSAGHVWSADTGYNSGTVYSTGAAISGTSDPALYGIGRYDPSSAPPTLDYSFSVPNGIYDVRLHFAEPGLPPGGRQFNVQVEGLTVYSNLDVAAEAGVLTALIKTVTVQVSDGQLNLSFLHGAVDNPFIDAIEVLSTDLPTTPLGFSVVAQSGTQLNLSWNSSSGNAAIASYRVERCQGANCTTFTEIAAPTGTAYSDSALSPLTVYRYRVRAADASGRLSSYSAVVTATTSSSGTYRTRTAAHDHGREWRGHDAHVRLATAHKQPHD